MALSLAGFTLCFGVFLGSGVRLGSWVFMLAMVQLASIVKHFSDVILNGGQYDHVGIVPLKWYVKA